MKSSSAVFSTQNPFPPDAPFGKTHYSPSRAKSLSKRQREKTALSPVRLSHPAPPSTPREVVSLTPEDKHFLAGSNQLLLAPPPSADPQPSFSESWPSSTELGSPSGTDSTASPEAHTPPQAAMAGKSQASAQSVGLVEDDSVLARYVERFRHGRPRSREERQREAATAPQVRPFWWKPSHPPPSSSSTPTQPHHTGDFSSCRLGASVTPSPPSLATRSRLVPPLSPPGTPVDLSTTALSDSSQCDPEILQLQQRARMLLQRSETSLSGSSVPVSSEGLGSSSFSSPISVDEPVHRPTVPSLIDCTTGSVSLPPPPQPSRAFTPHPESDILFQWRLRRKMELAQHHAGADTRTRHLDPFAQSNRAPATVTASTIGTRAVAVSPLPSPPVASPALTTPYTTVPAHLHLLCDVLPCPLHAPQPRARPCRDRDQPPSPEQISSSCSSEGTPSPAEGPPARNSVSRVRAEQQEAEEAGGDPSVPRCWERRSSGAVRTGGTRRDPVVSHPEKRTSRRTDREMDRHGGEQDARRRSGSSKAERGAVSRDTGGNNRPERAGSGREGLKKEVGRQERGQRSRRSGRREDMAPPSQLHSTLSQVVSETLFSPPASPSSSDSRPPPPPPEPPGHAPPQLPQAPAPPPSIHQQHPEVIIQLLQDAEDSDGLEFEDDALLQVLRQKRQQVKEQLSEVDTLLSEIPED
ncbi:proline and serine-rich protein 3 isoform X2 [Amia ocellicauda]|uniref:proline and serine-rich protein 3 isoform X2 n=1 Tax=Amia ocellicauda TaxID=2972642 RepID=UPI003464E295